MKNKLAVIFLSLGIVVSSLALALNFNGFQSLNGIGVTRVFTAPVPGVYFINGQLTLPMLTQNGNTSYSQVVATVSKNYATQLYQGAAGATGFQIHQMTLSTGDYINVALTSTVSADYINNAVSGQVSYGNTF